MLKKTFRKDSINFINYFIIKKDREALPSDILRGTRTEKILISKKTPKVFLKEIVGWVKNELANQEILLTGNSALPLVRYSIGDHGGVLGKCEG